MDGSTLKSTTTALERTTITGTGTTTTPTLHAVTGRTRALDVLFYEQVVILDARISLQIVNRGKRLPYLALRRPASGRGASTNKKGLPQVSQHQIALLDGSQGSNQHCSDDLWTPEEKAVPLQTDSAISGWVKRCVRSPIECSRMVEDSANCPCRRGFFYMHLRILQGRDMQPQ